MALVVSQLHLALLRVSKDCIAANQSLASPLNSLHRDRINSIEVIRKRRGGSVISVIYLFDTQLPKLSDSETIGPFYDHNQAQAVAKAIQSELLLDNRNEVQSAQYSNFQRKVVSKIVFGFLIVTRRSLLS